MDIRALTAADVADTVALWERAGLTRPWNPPEVDFARAVDGSTSTVLGGFVDDNLVATVMVGDDGHRGWVYYLAVAVDHRGRGHGRRMMDAAADWLRDRGTVKLQLMVRTTNEETIGFYEALGYEGADTVVLAKWLVEPDARP